MFYGSSFLEVSLQEVVLFVIFFPGLILDVVFMLNFLCQAWLLDFLQLALMRFVLSHVVHFSVWHATTGVLGIQSRAVLIVTVLVVAQMFFLLSAK